VLVEVAGSASQLEVGECGGAVVGPVGDVVGVAPGGGGAAFDAAAVAELERPAEGGGDEAGASAEVEHFGRAAHEDAADGGVARERVREGG